MQHLYSRGRTPCYHSQQVSSSPASLSFWGKGGGGWAPGSCGDSWANLEARGRAPVILQLDALCVTETSLTGNQKKSEMSRKMWNGATPSQAVAPSCHGWRCLALHPAANPNFHIEAFLKASRHRFQCVDLFSIYFNKLTKNE